MENPYYLERFKTEELKALVQLLKKDRDALIKEVQKREERMKTTENYSVTRKASFLGNITPNLEAKCTELLNSLEISFFPFLDTSMFNSSGNMFGKLEHLSLIMSYSELQSIAKQYGVESALGLSNLLCSNESKKANDFLKNEAVAKIISNARHLIGLEHFFQDENNILKYEAVYNAFRYLKNHLYTVISENNSLEENIKEIFKDKQQKNQIVERDFKKIAKALYERKIAIPNSHVTIFNQCISRWPNKKGTLFTPDQKDFIWMVAMCTTKEELEESDYKKVMELIFVPKKKNK